MSDHPKISIISTVYNTGPYLRPAVESILAQTFTDFELLLVDDGSHDGSAEVCNALARQDARIRVTAYDSSIFGSLPGKVVRVGADAVVDGEKKETYFEVLLEAEKNYLGDPSEHLTISPGMAADASIQTGKRTMMEYMLKPIVKTLDKSLRER